MRTNTIISYHVGRIPKYRRRTLSGRGCGLERRGDELTLFYVNRYLTQEIRATLRLSCSATTSVRGQELAGDLYAGNDDASPEAIVPRAPNERHGRGVPACISQPECHDNGLSPHKFANVFLPPLP